MSMSPLKAAAVAVAAAGAVIYGLLTPSKGGAKCDNSSASPSRSRSTTSHKCPSSPLDSYSRLKRKTRIPATSDKRHDSYHASRAPAHADDSHWPSSTSSHSRPSYIQAPSSTSIAKAAAKTKPKADRTTRDYDHHAYRTTVSVSRYARESRETLGTSARTHASHPPPKFSIRVIENEISTTTTAGYGKDIYRASRASHLAGETEVETQAGHTTSQYDDRWYRSSLASSRPSDSRETSVTSTVRTRVSRPPRSTSIRVSQTADHSHTIHRSSFALPPSPTRASYPRAPSPDTRRPHALGYSDTPLTRSRTLSSSSGSDSLGPISSTIKDERAAVALRKQARRSNREMREARDLVIRARKYGDYRAEQRHRENAIAYENEMNSLDKRAAKIIFRQNNKALAKGTVDLHGLHVSEALEYAKKELESAKDRNDDEICFITGRGSHSEGGLSKLRPHLAQLCDEHGLTYSLDPRNAGILIVQLN